MGKKTTKSWDKRQERKLRSYLRVNGYLYVCSKGSHDKFRSQITGKNVEINNHINKMVWKRTIEEVADDLKSKGYNYVPLMIKDNSLDSWICETEAALKRDLTAEEETRYIKETAHECMVIMIELSCSLEEAYNTLMN